MPLLLLTILVIVGILLWRAYQARNEGPADPIVVPVPDRPKPPRHQRVSDAELAERAATLREAIDDGTITFAEAVESLARTCGLEREEAADRLSR